MSDVNMYRIIERIREKGQEEVNYVYVNYDMIMNLLSCFKLRSLFKEIKITLYYCVQFEIIVGYSSRNIDSKRVCGFESIRVV